MAYATFVMPKPATQRQASGKTPTNRLGLKLDLHTGDIATDGAGRLILADPNTTNVEWGIIQLLTERYSALCFSRQIGVQIHAALALRQHAAVEQSLMLTVQHACTMPSLRITSVTNFVFTWSANTVQMALTFNLASGRPHRTTVAFSA